MDVGVVFPQPGKSENYRVPPKLSVRKAYRFSVGSESERQRGFMSYRTAPALFAIGHEETGGVGQRVCGKRMHCTKP